jgi:hypothetical protein
MTARLAVFAALLLWLGYESHFSPSFFIATVEASLASIADGAEAVLAADNNPAVIRTAAKDDHAF